ncbi:MAG: prolyl oligopeptidase family serine peptidase, partial [Aureliella sp.]
KTSKQLFQTYSTNAILVWLLLNCVTLHAQGRLQDYERSDTYTERTANSVFRDVLVPQWPTDDASSFWYQIRTAPGEHEFILVDCESGMRTAAFNHQALALALGSATQIDVAANHLELNGLHFDLPANQCRFQFAEKAWSYHLPAGPLLELDRSQAQDGLRAGLEPKQRVTLSSDSSERAAIRFDNRLAEELDVFWMPANGTPTSYGIVPAGESIELQSYVGHAWLLKTKAGDAKAAFVVEAWIELAVIDATTPVPKAIRNRKTVVDSVREAGISPDGKWQVSNYDDNVHLVDIESGEETFQTTDGDSNEGFSGRVWWSPDSQNFIVISTLNVPTRKISMIESSPPDSIHSRVLTIDYAKPGDDLEQPRPVLFHVADPKPIAIDNTLFSNPFSLNNFHWDPSSASFCFVLNQRGHQVLRAIAVDAETAVARTLVEETPETFVCYSSKSYVHYIGSDEMIWMSERSGWNHLYLIDKVQGKVKNPITSGEWVVREVVRVDDEQRVVWLAVSGIDPGQDPYYQHLIRVGYDGENVVRLTEGDGDHQWQFSPDNRFLIDSYSRVDMPPHRVLRDAESGQLICELEHADDERLLQTGWHYPERFTAKGRDGETDIYGVIVRPTNFEPDQKYPVLEAIYAGPHSAFVPKGFGRYPELYEMAELGFIVVKIDGMGTNHRSKSFHDVCWKNLADSGFPDRIAWMRAAASERPEMDLSRVGIWGGSAGGQSAMRAVIDHGDFYHAAVADCGCHDNRVDKLWWNEQWMGWPVGPHYAEQSNVTGAQRLQGALMLIWGELDQNVDPASSMQVIEALVQGDKDFEQLVMPGVGHGAAGHPYAKRRQADFFVRHLWHREPRQ